MLVPSKPAPSSSQISGLVPPNLDPDYLQELAERLDDHARQLDREVQDLKKRAQEFRAAATKSKSKSKPNTQTGHLCMWLSTCWTGWWVSTSTTMPVVWLEPAW